MAAKLVCYGDLCMDIFVRTDAFPQPGQDATVNQAWYMPGGSAPNCAVTAARLGISTQFLGVTGQDEMADMLIDDLRQNSVGVEHLRRAAASTAMTIAILGPNGERTFFSYRGANASPYGPLPADLLTPGDYLHLSGYSFQSEASRPTATTLIKQARANGAVISLDPSFHFASAKPSLAGLDFIFPNFDEARLLSGLDDPKEAAEQIRSLGPRTVIVKLGAQGCYVASDTINAFVPTYPATQAVDTTGAGDAFCGGFLGGVMWGLDMVEAARIGHMAAVHVISKVGGHTGAPALDNLIRFASQHDESLAETLQQITRSRH